MKTATKIKDLEGWRGHASLYELFSSDAGAPEYVVVSATVVPFTGPETYIFPARADGTVINFAEREGSYRGGLDHATALQNAGYKVKS